MMEYKRTYILLRTVICTGTKEILFKCMLCNIQNFIDGSYAYAQLSWNMRAAMPWIYGSLQV